MLLKGSSDITVEGGGVSEVCRSICPGLGRFVWGPTGRSVHGSVSPSAHAQPVPDVYHRSGSDRSSFYRSIDKRWQTTADYVTPVQSIQDTTRQVKSGQENDIG